MRRTRLHNPSAFPIEQYEVLAPKKNGVAVSVLLRTRCGELDEVARKMSILRTEA